MPRLLTTWRSAAVALIAMVLVSCNSGGPTTPPNEPQTQLDPTLTIDIGTLSAAQTSPIVPIEIELGPTGIAATIPVWVHVGFRIGLSGTAPISLMSVAEGSPNYNNQSVLVDLPPEGTSLIFDWDALEDLGDTPASDVVIRAGVLWTQADSTREAVCTTEPIVSTNFGATFDCAADAPRIEGGALDQATIGETYSDFVTSTEGTPPVFYDIISVNGVAPAPGESDEIGFGLFINEQTGEVFGIPAAGTPSQLNIAVRAIDNCGGENEIEEFRAPAQAVAGTRFDQALFTIAVDGGIQPLCADPPVITTTALDPMTVGVPYSFQLQATGGEGALSWDQSDGNLGSRGLTLDTNGLLSGTPTLSGTPIEEFRVTDSCPEPQSASVDLTLNIACSPDFPEFVGACAPEARGGQGGSSCAFPPAFLNQPYDFTFTATAINGFGTVVRDDGSLHTGLTEQITLGSFSTTIRISGTPTEAGEVGSNPTLVYEATDLCEQASSIFPTIFLNGLPACTEPPPVIQSNGPTTDTLPDATEGTLYSQTLSVIDGTPPVGSISIVDQTIPGAPLSIDDDGRTLTGTILGETAGDYFVTVAVTDGCSTPRTDQRTFGITIQPSCDAIVITTKGLPQAATNGVAFNFQFTADGGFGQLAWALAVTSGPLPAGLTLAADGTISGIPNDTPGTFPLNVTVTDQCPTGPNVTAGSFDLILNPAPSCNPITIEPATLPDPTYLVEYDQTLLGTGGIAPYTFALETGFLPSGMTLNSDGTITGFPDTTEDVGQQFDFTVRATDSCSIGPATITRSYSIIVQPPDCGEPPVITNTSFPNPVFTQGYNATLLASGGFQPYEWNLLSGALPSGMSVNIAGTLEGTPDNPDEVGSCFTFTIRVNDTCPSGNQTADATFTFKLQDVPTCNPIAFILQDLPDPELNRPYGVFIPMAGEPPFTYEFIGGTLPDGVTFETATGNLRGPATNPSQEGSDFTFTLQVTDSCFLGPQVATMDYTITLNDFVCRNLEFTTFGLPHAILDQPYLSQIGATGEGNIIFTLPEGGLPDGLSMDPAGLITGTPTETGEFEFAVSIEDECDQFDSAFFNIRVVTEPGCATEVQFDIEEWQIPDPVALQPYSFFLPVSGGLPPYTFFTEGGLPAGISLNESTGEIFGMASSVGEVGFSSIEVSDSCPEGNSFDSLFAEMHVQAADPLCAFPSFEGAHFCIECPTEVVGLTSPQPLTINYVGVGRRAEFVNIFIRFSDPRIGVDLGSLIEGTAVTQADGSLDLTLFAPGVWQIHYDGPDLDYNGSFATVTLTNVDPCVQTFVFTNFSSEAFWFPDGPAPIPSSIDSCGFEAQ